ncbi:MAG TPA: bifunctional glutamine synthetase adenylyltransferase/deadenyltransferase, partial [Usitatibacter sp.]|nr:bifunctional glutamine synthetase adenylyltransferase/deadenyltransferase [Usitatibacter sp.]
MRDTPASESFRAALDRTLRLSPYVARVAAARPALVQELERESSHPFGREQMRACLHEEGEALGVRLRRLRERVMVRLAYRDLNGEASLDEVFATTTALAEESIAVAASQAERGAASLHGEREVGSGLVVMGLGKLGGCELNVSSDVDLVFLYGESAQAREDKRASDSEFFSAAGRSLIALLSDVTPEGYVFRVDMRLRP